MALLFRGLTFRELTSSSFFIEVKFSFHHETNLFLFILQISASSDVYNGDLAPVIEEGNLSCLSSHSSKDEQILLTDMSA